MGYVKTTWVTGDTITADKLNHAEEGIDKATIKIVPIQEGTQDTLGMTWQEIKDLSDAGYLMCVFAVPYFVVSVDEQDGLYGVGVYETHLDENQHLANTKYFITDSVSGYPVLQGSAG